MLTRLISAATMLGLATAGSAAAAEPLTEQQIMRLAPGTFHAVVKGKYELTVTLKRDGAIIGTIPGLEDRGRWTVQNNQLCIVLPTWTRGHVVCSAVVADNGWYHSSSVSFRKL